MKKHFIGSILFLFLFASSIALATEVIVDGSLNDSGWQSAKRNKANYQVVPQTLTKVESNFSYQKITTDHSCYCIYFFIHNIFIACANFSNITESFSHSHHHIKCFCHILYEQLSSRVR